MEDSLAEERVLRQHADALLKDQSQPIGRVTGIFEQYRALWLANTIAHFDLAERRQSQLWDLHQAGRRYFRDALVPMRKEGAGKAVVARQLASIYRQWIKDAVAFYRAYIYRLNSAFGGIPELQTVAHEMKQEVGESSQASLTPEVRNLVLNCCHQTLIHLGDLSRYRASEQLDKRPDFGPALGFYGLANTLRPSSGLGFHQQAVVQLELKDHLKAVYYLYRAAVVHDPHPLAAKNLQLEFGKVNAAWEKGQLIPKTGPADPEAPRHILIGWFVRMHSMCAKGDVFRSHEELESELISQLSAAVKKEGVMAETTLRRMTMTNLAAQYHSGLLFQANPEMHHQQAFLYFLRLNIKTYTAILEIFYSTLNEQPADAKEGENLAAKITPLARRLLPVLRLYSSWLTANVHLVAGLQGDVFLSADIKSFWTAYARSVDILADEDMFGVWNLDECEASYMLVEDADTFGFKPLQDEHQKVWSNWMIRGNTAVKPKFSDAGVERMPEEDEMLARIKGLLEDGSYLAHDIDEAPIGIVGDRIYYGQALDNAKAAAEDAKNKPPELPKPVERPAPLSYAAAARSGQTVGARQPKPTVSVERSSKSSRSRQSQMARMVDNVLDDDDGNAPVTPPQQHVSHPAVVNGDSLSHGLADAVQPEYTVTGYQPKHTDWRSNAGPHNTPRRIPPPAIRTPRDVRAGSSAERLHAVSKIWNDGGSNGFTSPSGFPSGLPTGTLSSPPQLQARAAQHSRGNSASSVRSRNSQNIAESWSSLESAPNGQLPLHLNGLGTVTPTHNTYSNFSASGAVSPLLFGAGGGIWSTRKKPQRNTSPTNGQG